MSQIGDAPLTFSSNFRVKGGYIIDGEGEKVT